MNPRANSGGDRLGPRTRAKRAPGRHEANRPCQPGSGPPRAADAREARTGLARSHDVCAPRWWESLYDDWLADTVLASASDEAATLGYLEEHLALAPGARVLDQCCGTGRLALPLAARGYQVVGVDQAAGYIARAARGARRCGVDVELHAADAFAFVPRAPVAGAFNWWTSFGYAAEDADNLEMLRRARDALEPGGRFALETMHAEALEAAFVPFSRREFARAGQRVELTRKSRLADGALWQRWRFRCDDGRERRCVTRVRLYRRAALEGLFERAGLEVLAFHGGLDGAPLARESARCIVLGRRRP
jgi:SAM-dependent methyltransferase